MPTPNLFNFATSELSQDAFICWLAAWADPAHRDHDQALHDTAIAFLDRLLEIGKGLKVPEYRSVAIYRQWNHIDVLVDVNDDFAIVIEDKTDTEDPTRKLLLTKKRAAKHYPEDRIAAVYLKTGDQCDYSSAEKAGYGCFLRKDFLDILDRGARAGVKNDIFADFHTHLRRIEAAVQSYRNVPLDKWGQNPKPWMGFFMALRERLGEGEWDQKGYPGGSSVSFRCWRDNESKFLRLMGDELAFRIVESDVLKQPTRWDEWNQAMMKKNGTAGIAIKSAPRRLGRRMSVAVLDGDYRQANEQWLFDFERTVDVVRNALKLMEAALESVGSGQ